MVDNTHLKCTVKLTTFVQWTVLSPYLADKYGCRFARFEGCFENDSEHSFDLDKEDSLADWQVDELQTILDSGNFEDYQLGVLMQDAVNKGFLNPGSYVVEVCW